MQKALIIVGLFIAATVFTLGASLHNVGQRNVRLLANYHRLAIGQHLVDLDTGMPVRCTTDTDCQNKTGIPY